MTALFSNKYVKLTLILAMKKIPLYLCTVRKVFELLLHTYVILQSRGMYSLSIERGRVRIEEKIVVLFEWIKGPLAAAIRFL